MNIAETMAFLGSLMLVLVISFSALSMCSRASERNLRAREDLRSWEKTYLITLVFVLMLAILGWQVV